MKIQGDLWKYKIPLFYGQCNFFVCKDLTDKGMNNEANILCMSKKMTQAYVNNLSENDLSLIAISFLNAVNVFQTIDLWSSQNLKMLNAAIADLRNIYTTGLIVLTSKMLSKTIGNINSTILPRLGYSMKIGKITLQKIICTTYQTHEKRHHVLTQIRALSTPILS
ncbi:hypothetical protein LN149_001631 [Providencia stuartii]|nr:hypothetical protein [Providencia stuartii]